MSGSLLQLLDPRTGDAETFCDLSVAHGLPHFPDGVTGDGRVLSRETLSLCDGAVGCGHSLDRVRDVPDRHGRPHAQTVYPQLDDVQGEIYDNCMSTTSDPASSLLDEARKKIRYRVGSTWQAADGQEPWVRLFARCVVNPTTGCWEHQRRGRDGTLSVRPGQYSNLRVGKVQVPAHRIAWEHANQAEIPEGLFVCHRCDNPPCQNPAHLFLGTALDNNRDRKRKGRNGRPPREALGTYQRSKTHCPQGHPYSGKNVLRYTTADGRNTRTCLRCARERELAKRHRRHAEQYQARCQRLAERIDEVRGRYPRAVDEVSTEKIVSVISGELGTRLIRLLGTNGMHR